MEERDLPLGADNKAFLAELKARGNDLNRVLTEIGQRNHRNMPPMYEGPETAKLEADVHRSNDALFEARRALQTALMWANRAVVNPEGFC